MGALMTSGEVIMIDIIVDEGISHSDLPDDARMRQAVAAACAQAGVSRAVSLCARVAGDDVVHDLNRQWRHEDAVTDVLSFPMQEGPDLNFDESLGDIILAWPFVTREASRLGLNVCDHALHLIVHGVLHLLGYDHAEEVQAKRMQTMESHAMVLLGLHDPYGKKCGKERMNV